MGFNSPDRGTIFIIGGDTDIISNVNSKDTGSIYIRGGRFVIDNSNNDPVSSALSGIDTITKGN